MFHASSGMEDEIHLVERGFGLVMISSRDLRSLGPAFAIYLLWKAIPLDLTALAKIFCLVSSATNLLIDSGGPEI